jgi:poly(hydroxyalkanoate) granule-associated protein
MPKKDLPFSPSSVQASAQAAQRAWQTGLDALQQAQQQGSKMFDALVQEGLTMQQRAQTAAQGHLKEAGAKAQQLGKDLSQQAEAKWDKLEGLFEERVSLALQRLGVPTAKEVEALRDRIAALEDQLAQAKPAASKPRASAQAPGRASPSPRPNRSRSRTSGPA